MKLSGIVKISLLFIALYLTGCATKDRGADYVSHIKTREYDQSYFRELISDENYKSAFLRYYSLYPEGRIGEDWNSLQHDLTEGMAGEFYLALDNKEYPQAISLFNSLERTGNEKLLDRERGELYFEYFSHLMEKDYAGAAASWFLNKGTEMSLDDSELTRIESYFLEKRLSSSMKLLRKIMEERDQALSEESTAFLDGNTDKKDMLNGTATIWVNRGIRLENGVGYPDRVIGSGFFIDPRGYLLTNYHVISSEVDPTYEGYSRLYVKLNENENERIPAVVVGWDPILDLALLKVEITPPYVFSFAEEDDYSLGESIFAIGSPGGLSNTVTSGTISNLGRELQAIGRSLQVDVPINPGNSGGPLINQNGEAIGIVYAGVEEYEGVNFAIPASYVKELLPRLYDGGKIEYGWLGIVAYKEFDRIINRYVVPDTPAELSSFDTGDQILRLNGEPVNGIPDIQNRLISALPGEMVNLTVLRDGKETVVPLGIEARPDYPMMTLLNRDSIDNLFAPIFGMSTVRLNQGRSFRQYRVEDVYPGSVADEAGLVTGDSFTLNRWVNSDEDKVLIIQIIIKARKSGFMQSGLQLGVIYGMNYFL